MTESNNSGNINLSFSMSARKLKLAGVILAIITAFITLVVALVFGISGSNQASKNEVSIAATLAELQQKGIVIKTNATLVENLRIAFNSAQSDATAARSKVDATLESLRRIQNDLEGSLATTESLLTTTNESLTQTTEGLAQTKEDITAQVDSIDDVERSLEAVKNTFTQTRDIANANKRDLKAANTLTQWLVLSDAYNSWTGTITYRTATAISPPQGGTDTYAYFLDPDDGFVSKLVKATGDDHMYNLFADSALSYLEWLLASLKYEPTASPKVAFEKANQEFLIYLQQKIEAAS